jgi:hypothetical protein
MKKVAILDPQDRATTKAKRRQASVTTKKRRYLLSIKRKLNLQSLPLQGNPAPVTVKLEAKPQWCQVGDLDLMKAGLGQSRRGQILLTLEPVSGNDMEPQVRVVAVDEILSGVQHTFHIDPDDSQGGVGLFLCLNSSGRKTCRDNKIRSIETLTDAYFNDKKNVKVNDPVFYYQFFMAGERSLDLFESHKDGESFYKDVERLARIRIPDRADRNRALNRTRTTYRKLGPVPANIRDDAIHILLPYMDPKCLANR